RCVKTLNPQKMASDKPNLSLLTSATGKTGVFLGMGTEVV
ncbi:MAG: hypothetical protein US92_C0009G0022, partial [Candidatus Peregrinibacteria bacterium GW2011_GWA2_38_36]